MAFKDLANFIDPDLHLPYNGTTYTVPAATVDLGLYLHTIYTIGIRAASGVDPTETDTAKLDDGQEQEFVERCLGADLMAEVRADGVPFKIISLMAQTLLFDTVADRDTAEAFWASAGKAPAPNRTARRTATRTSTAAAPTTKKPASPNGTTTRKATAAKR